MAQLTTTWLTLLLGVLPWLLAGSLISGWAGRWLTAVPLPSQRRTAVLLILALATALPLGEYGIIPVAHLLRQNGWPRWAILLLILAAPILTPLVLIGTAATYGLPLALARTVLGLAVSLLASQLLSFSASQHLYPNEYSALSTQHSALSTFLRYSGYAAVATFLAAVVTPTLPRLGSSWLSWPLHALLQPSHAVWDGFTAASTIAPTAAPPFWLLLIALTLGAQLDLASIGLWLGLWRARDGQPVAPRFLSPLIALAWGGFAYFLIISGRISDYANEQMGLVLLVMSLLLLLLGLTSLRPHKQGADAPSWASLWLMPPLLLGLLIPAPPATTAGHLLFIAWDEADTRQLVRADPESGVVQPLTQLAADYAVLDFSPAPNGSLIAYTVQNPNRSSDIWTIDPDGRQPYQLLDCLGSACGAPVWTADGSRLIYERRGVDNPYTPRLWWLDPVTGDSLPVFADRNVLAYGAQFSPNGRWLSFRTPNEPDISLYNLETGDIKTVPSQTGELGAWHPQGDYFYYTNVNYLGTIVVMHMFQADLTTGEQGGLTSVMAAVNDGSLAWSPDGRWLVFGRQPARAATGKQLWLLATDGRDPTQLTNDPIYNHGWPAWSADSQTLAYQRFDTSNPTSDPEIWVLDVATGEQTFVAPAGVQPRWLGR